MSSNRQQRNVIAKKRKKKVLSKSFATVEDLAKLLHVSEDKLYRMVDAEKPTKKPKRKKKRES